MMRDKTIKKRTKKLMEKVNRKVDKEMKEKYGDLYKTKAEKNRAARQSERRYQIMQIIFLIQNLKTTGQFNEEIRKLASHLPSEFDKFLN